MPVNSVAIRTVQIWAGVRQFSTDWKQDCKLSGWPINEAIKSWVTTAVDRVLKTHTTWTFIALYWRNFSKKPHPFIQDNEIFKLVVLTASYEMYRIIVKFLEIPYNGRDITILYEGPRYIIKESGIPAALIWVVTLDFLLKAREA